MGIDHFNKQTPNYFAPWETKCKGCDDCNGTFDITDDFRGKMNGVRHDLGESMNVTGPARCAEKNRKTKGASPRSAHVMGRALDISVKDQAYAERLKLVVDDHGLRRGIYRRDGKVVFLHIDDLLGERQNFEVDLD